MLEWQCCCTWCITSHQCRSLQGLLQWHSQVQGWMRVLRMWLTWLCTCKYIFGGKLLPLKPYEPLPTLLWQCRDSARMSGLWPLYMYKYTWELLRVHVPTHPHPHATSHWYSLTLCVVNYANSFVACQCAWQYYDSITVAYRSTYASQRTIIITLPLKRTTQSGQNAWQE